MAPDESPLREPIARRRAWSFTEEDAPRLADALAGGDRWRAFWRYWVTDNLWNLIDLLAHFGMKLLPMDACSRLGATLGLFAVPRFHKVASRRARETIRHLRPDLNAEEQEALFLENCRAQGRLMTEFSVLNRLQRHRNRLRSDGLAPIRKAADEGPVIVVGLHLGNWEVGPIALRHFDLQAHAFYVPPKSRAKAWIAERVRSRAGLRFLPPGAEGIRPALKVLKSGGVVSMFCDEGFGGMIRGPFFDRKPHQEGNLALAVRLARMTGATICPWYGLRTDGFRFECQALEPIRLPASDPANARLLDDMLLLNDAIEPIVRAHLDQWYFLDNALRPE
ncbi:lysophospholipid acyltransferase family protein [Ensifer sesbaniae]|uniref:lysophospholipid acyltransferase family protein n=1 Tax=Ensifer sesbaniae TaxID=1214071 RepID=UPI001568C428|nr:lipid A biosynthesis lauroyl acyltransferase [Ensifer sesbaniae]NRQ14208.1 Lipid A biosynthesis lauroyltransferase [Ensifer sesbaniae]